MRATRSPSPGRKVLVGWLAVGGLAVLIAAPLWGPLQVGWRCYARHAAGQRAQAEVLAKLEPASFALTVAEGPHAGKSCTADTSAAIYAQIRPGDRLEVVYLDWREGQCELVSTVEASGQLLWALSGALAAVLLGLLWLGLFLQRSFGQPVFPPRRMEVEHEVRCPACEKPMEQGYVPLLAGMHWRALGEPIGLPHAAGGLPGTVGWRQRPRLHALRCASCEVLTLQYGRPR
jgi:hypothetical protein